MHKTTTFGGLTAAYVAKLLGSGLGPTLYKIDHSSLEYGVHHEWRDGEQFYTIEGLLRIVEELRTAGHPGPAIVLQTELDGQRARQAAADRLGDKMDPVLAKRWDLQAELNDEAL